ncbi:MAG: YfhO family protein, partial [Chloroflexota bacterium]|nr:YfhO family protein [Chloroflexota bacterium]
PYTGAEAFLVNLKAEGEVFRYFGLDELHWVEERSLRENSYTSRFDTVDVARAVPPPRAMLLDLDGIQGYDPVHILRYEEFFIGVNGKGQNYHFIEVLHDGVDSPLLDLLNLRYVVVPSGVDGGWDGAELIDLGYFDSEVYADEHVRILVNESALPRAWVVHDVVTVDEGSAMETLTSPGFDPTTTAVIETSPPSLAAATGPEEVTWVPTETSDVVAADVTLSADGLVVFSEIWDPNWVAYVDGSKTDLLVANHILRAVAVPAGAHRVEIRYESETLRIGLWISIAAWLAIVTLAGTTLVDRRR